MLELKEVSNNTLKVGVDSLIIDNILHENELFETWYNKRSVILNAKK